MCKYLGCRGVYRGDRLASIGVICSLVEILDRLADGACDALPAAASVCKRRSDERVIVGLDGLRVPTARAKRVLGGGERGENIGERTTCSSSAF